MKIFILIISCLLATTMIAQEKEEAPNMPFYNKQKVEQALSRQAEYDTVWLPVKVTEYIHLLDTTFLHEYEYTESGLLQKWTCKYSTGMSERIYNQTYTMEEEDVLDTVTFYKYDDYGNLIPDVRTVCENHHADFSWVAFNDQKWKNDQWVTTHRIERYFMDTLDVVGFCYWEDYWVDGVYDDGYRRSLKFDEHQKVIGLTSQIYFPNIGDFRMTGEYEYLYDENDVCHEAHIFKINPYDQEERKLVGKVCWEWEEFHGFLNGDIVYFEYFEKPNFRRPNKPATISSYDSEDDGLSFYSRWMQRSFWNIDGNNSAEREIYVEYGDSLLMETLSGIYYDEQGNTTGDIERWMYPPYHYGNYHDTCVLNKHTYINYYDERNRFYKYDVYQIYFDDRFNDGSRDNVLILTYVVDSFTYVLKKVNIEELLAESHDKLKIIPNPSDGYIKIIASDEMEEIGLYAMDGRLVYNRKAAGKETELGNYILPKGTYVIKAKLKNGGVQTGKVVMR